MMMRRSSNKFSEIVEKWRKRRKGHFAVYAKEGKRRFVVPLYYLKHPIFRVLLEMAEEEFGSTVRGPLKVPCEEELVDYILSLLRKINPPVDEEDRAFVSTSIICRGSSSISLFPLFHSHNHQGGQRTIHVV
uniref:Auxin-responsive protein SAUR36-like n=1 Tax=Nelumbo nucifera TaxID=4432 RepID=A0A822ZJ73_NELNU|nr:TPA_asm: hypothetical protein HUJ06_016091 [Nelumbo nucifera]